MLHASSNTLGMQLTTRPPDMHLNNRIGFSLQSSREQLSVTHFNLGITYHIIPEKILINGDAVLGQVNNLASSAKAFSTIVTLGGEAYLQHRQTAQLDVRLSKDIRPIDCIVSVRYAIGY